jgi:XTP/dITP diphosphohydrolase
MKQLIIVLGTKNPHKVREILAIYRLSGKKPNIRFIPLSRFDNIPDVKESGRTYLANAAKKAISWARHTGLPVLAEDSGIEVKALDWQPGIYSARYASRGNTRNAPHRNNNQKLLSKLQGLPMSKRTARYRCSAVIALPDGKIIARAQGTCWGRIAFKPVGQNGFGYDPVFVPKFAIPNSPFAIGSTFGQLPASFKHRISHRSIALRKIFRKISQFLDIS